jgi:N-acetylneuraminic acid mutarotase
MESDAKTPAWGRRSALAVTSVLLIFTMSTAAAQARVVGQWQTDASLPYPQFEPAAAGYRGHLYVFGNSDPRTAASDSSPTYRYDPAADSWISLARMPGTQSELTAVAGQNGDIYVAAGSTLIGGRHTDAGEFFEYRPADDSWTRLPDIPESRRYLALARGGDGRIYAIGGLDSHNIIMASREVDAYSPSLGTWTRVADLKYPTSSAQVATGRQGNIYVFGGVNFATMRRAERYSVASNSWSSLPRLPVRRESGGAVRGADNRIYLVGGLLDPHTFVKEVDVWSPTARRWLRPAASFPPPRFSPGVGVVRGVLYSVGGCGAARCPARGVYSLKTAP